MSAKDQVKLVLATIEPLQRQLKAADAAWSEIDGIAGALSVRKAELVETEAWLQRTKAAAQDATSRLDELTRNCAKEEKRITTKIDGLKAEMLELEKTVGERRLELDSIMAGMAALHQRTRV